MRVLVTGATGFIGRRVAQQLVAWRHEVRCLVRGASDLSSLQALPVDVWRGDITDPGSVPGALEDIQAVVHLVGIIQERGNATFNRIHVDGTRNLIQAAITAGVQHVVYLSGAGAGPNPRYPYLFTKWQAEELVRTSGIPWTVLRSSVVYGPGDGFLTQLAAVVRHPPMGDRTLSPVIPVLGSGRTRFQPVHVEDIARCLLKCVEDPELRARTLEVGGPDAYTYEQLVDLVIRATGTHRPKIHVPLLAVRPAVALMARFLSNPPLTPTQLAMLALDNVPKENAIESVLGITPRRLSEHLGYLR